MANREQPTSVKLPDWLNEYARRDEFASQPTEHQLPIVRSVDTAKPDVMQHDLPFTFIGFERAVEQFVGQESEYRALRRAANRDDGSRDVIEGARRYQLELGITVYGFEFLPRILRRFAKEGLLIE